MGIYKKELDQAQKNDQHSLPLEQRLVFAMLGAPFLPIAPLRMGWTGHPSVSGWNPITANIAIGFMIMGNFICTYQYLDDASTRMR